MDKNEIGKIQPVEITHEMRKSYLDYAMSVIVARALPDVRDGLKPVHRRILYSMHQMGLSHSSRYSKSAKVVGETMGKYHPHGDMAIYDSLVRMAQDFSMRYPLIDGQGNFGCFTKDTKVKLTNGKDLSFEQLIKESQKGKKNYTYTINALGLISIAEIKNPRLTRKKAEIIKITLDNEKEIKCTPNHLFMLKDGTYKEAEKLKPGDSLMPLYQKFSEKTDRLNRKGYVLIYQNKNDTWVPAHHLADNYNLNIKKYEKNIGRLRHHLDFDRLNNNPDNIVRMGWQEHWQIHYQQASSLHKNNEYRKKIADGRNNYWSNPFNKAKHSKLLSERNIKNWQNPKYREKMRRFLSEVNKQYIQTHPEKRREFSLRLTKTLKRLWQDPKYCSLMHEKIIKGNKNHTTNQTGKLKFLNICKEAVRQFLVLNEKNYSKASNKIYPYRTAPLWKTALNKYFQNNPDLVRQEINNNHRVVKIEKISKKENVYDLTIEGTHNFCLATGVFVHNSIDGDSAAAFRYTEVKLAKITQEMIADIDKGTVDFQDNFDGSLKEPVFLPSKLPNLLLMGSDGIAVGMATKIPPHNLSEVADALVFMIEKGKVIYSKNENEEEKSSEGKKKSAFEIKKIELNGEDQNQKALSADFESDVSIEEDLMKFIKGPDFPTGASIYNRKDILQAYTTGNGKILVRAKAEIEEAEGEKFRIVITEIPYQVNKSNLVAKIAQLAKERKIDGIMDLRDESDRQGLRVVVELKKTAKPKTILNNLYKNTQMQISYPVNAVTLVNGIPMTLNLKQILTEFIRHRQKVVTKKTIFELDEAKRQAHILEGLKIALDNLDAVIETIKKSKDAQEAKINLMTKFELTEIQANAILEMQLRRLAALERKKIEDEYKEIMKKIEYLVGLLALPKKILDIIKKEILEIKEKYADPRRTKVYVQALENFNEEDLITQEDCLIIQTKGGYIKRVPIATYRSQKRGGKGVTGMTTKPEDEICRFLTAKTHDAILFFTNQGRVFSIRAWEIPEGSRQAKGQAVINLINISQEEKIQSVLPISLQNNQEKNQFLIMVTKKGIVKKTKLKAFENIRVSGLIAIKLNKDDELCWLKLVNEGDHTLLVSHQGKSIRFKEKDVRPTGRDTMGVRGIRLKKDDFVVGMEVFPPKLEEVKDKRKKLFRDVLIIMEHGLGKRTKLEEYRLQRRGGIGIRAAHITPKTGNIVASRIIDEKVIQIILTSKKAHVIKLPIKNVPRLGRDTQGVIFMRFNKPDDTVAAVTCLE